MPATLVLYETPRRLKAFLNDAADILGPERQAAVCRELTKRFEDVRRMTLGELAGAAEGFVVKGECVVVVDRAAPGSAMGTPPRSRRASRRRSRPRRSRMPCARSPKLPAAAPRGLPARARATGPGGEKEEEE